MLDGDTGPSITFNSTAGGNLVLAFAGWSSSGTTFLSLQMVEAQKPVPYPPAGQTWIWLQKANRAGMEGASGPLRPWKAHLGLCSWGWGWWDGKGKWSSITLPYRNQTATIFQFILSADHYYNRSIFVRIKLDTTILITDIAHWLYTVPSQQFEVILVILEYKCGITIMFWKKKKKQTHCYRRGAHFVNVTQEQQ